MTKLGKTARKFARKNLQSVLKQRRKYKAKRDSFNRKKTSKSKASVEDEEKVMMDQSPGGAVGGNFLDTLFSEDEDNSIEDVSDSDGFLSEDPDCPYISQSESEDDSEGKNKEIHLELAKQKGKLDRLKKKDPNFLELLESNRHDLRQIKSEETYLDEEVEINDEGGTTANESLNPQQGKILTTYSVDVWCWFVMEQPNGFALPNLLNAFRAACHYGNDDSDETSWGGIPNREVYSKILTFVLYEADGIFRILLGLPDSCFKESISKLKSIPEWKSMRSLIKSYLRSSLFLLNQLTDNQILVFTISRLRPSIVFFTAFPSLVGRLMKIAVHLWATGEESLSLSSFCIIRDMASQLGSDCLETCLAKTYKSFSAHCKFVEPTKMKHVESLRDSIVELYSLDVQRSYMKVLVALQQLANVLQCAFKTKKKEELEKIYNWQYINCIDLWVKFILWNIRDLDLQPLLYLAIQIIRGVVHLFPGQCYLPLRLKCVQMLNQLSHSSGVFIPIASLVLDPLEYRESGNAEARPRIAFSLQSILKVPKQLLKCRQFQEECSLSAVELLAEHFTQWSYHISFPELATIPLILLKRFHEKTTVEGLRRAVKRLIDQVEQNCEFVQRKRDGVAFSPNDHASVEAFLQLEKSNGNAPFTRYRNTVQQKSSSRNVGIR